MSPRAHCQAAEDAAFARAKQALRGIESEKAAIKQHELQQLELAAAFMRLEEAEAKQWDRLTGMHQKRHGVGQRGST